MKNNEYQIGQIWSDGTVFVVIKNVFKKYVYAYTGNLELMKVLSKGNFYKEKGVSKSMHIIGELGKTHTLKDDILLKISDNKENKSLRCV